MTKAQKALRDAREARSKNRQRLAEIGVMAEGDWTDEIRSEMDGLEAAIPDLERRERAAQIAVDAEEAEQRDAGNRGEGQDLDDAETRERRELRSKTRLHSFVTAAVQKRSADGEAAEYMASLDMPLVGANGGTAFPIELLAPPAEARGATVETRATTAVDTAVQPRTWLDRLFADTAAMRLGVSMESVPVGVASYPLTTAGASAAQRGKDEAAADTAWTISVVEAKPKGNRITLKFSMEDTARVPGLEAALTRDMRMAMAEGTDRAIFLGDSGASGADADITGLQTAAITETTITQTNKVKGPETLTAFTGMVDGIHAATLADLNVVAAIGAWRLWETTVINSGADNMTLAAFLREAGLSWSSRGSIETATANGDFGAFVGRARGMSGAAVAAVWEAGELIRDPYTDAAKGTIHLSLCYLWDFQIVRAANLQRIKFVT